MQLAILSLDDAWIGILVDRTVLQGEEMAPMGAVIADGKTQWRARSLLGSRQRLEIVVDEHVSAILQGNSIRTALVVLDVEQGNRSPGITTVATKTGGKFGIMSTHQNLQSAILQLQDRWLDAVD